ncbi:DDB1- and CUL4-associated factor 15 isoform X2 [Malurus melanocephalus]|uniref:DDB1- and CUL4-associated factor 15 isoform X2 n=1 Tax=Malurus melanocephalus TaxID=175006 RepID=UPI002549B434|nr:DDB1- and CUL4-associated factor 15 isoform X2 [Malurus melanocephalus]
MAPSSKAERGGPGGKRGAAGGAGPGAAPRGRREHLVRQLDRVRLNGQLSPRLFRKLPPRVCVTLKSIVDEEFLWAGHIFLGFSKCGRYVLSYTSSSGDDDFSFYLYHLYWWEFNVHSKLRLVRQVRLFQDEEIYSDLYLTVCEWPGDSDKVIVFGFNTRSAPGLQMNMMLMSDENHRDIYVSAVAVPPPRHCPACRRASAAPGDASPACLRHGFLLHTKFQVVYPFPTFQPAFQLRKDHVVLLNTSFSLVACAIAVHPAGDSNSRQILYERRNIPGASRRGENAPPAAPRELERAGRASPSSQPPLGHPQTPDLTPTPPSPAVAKAKEFVADLFRRAQGAGGGPGGAHGEGGDEPQPLPRGAPPEVPPPAPGIPPGEPHPPGTPHGTPPEPGYVNYTKLRYVLEPGEPSEDLEDDKISLPFVVTDLSGRSLRPLRDRATAQGQYLTVEQLTLDFEYVINEVIRNDAAWSHQFCSFSDYDIVILEVLGPSEPPEPPGPPGYPKLPMPPWLVCLVPSPVHPNGAGPPKTPEIPGISAQDLLRPPWDPPKPPLTLFHPPPLLLSVPPGVPGDQPGGDKHRPAVAGLPLPRRGGAAPVRGVEGSQSPSGNSPGTDLPHPPVPGPTTRASRLPGTSTAAPLPPWVSGTSLRSRGRPACGARTARAAWTR